MLCRVSWTCPACDHQNAASLVCDACGVARRWHEDPPLDLPAAPAWFEVGASYLAMMWGGLAGAGLLVLALPPLQAWLGLAPGWLLLEVVLAGAAAWSSLQEAFFLSRFNGMSLEAPRQVRSGQALELVLTLVPYQRVDGLDVRFELYDRYYQEVQRQGRKQVETRQRLLERLVMARDHSLAGRRSHHMHAVFDAPYPSTVHEHLGAKIMASLLEPLGFLVPGLRHHARNLREHGGFYVRATVRVGVFQRRFEQRVVSVYMGEGRVVAG